MPNHKTGFYASDSKIYHIFCTQHFWMFFFIFVFLLDLRGKNQIKVWSSHLFIINHK